MPSAAPQQLVEAIASGVDIHDQSIANLVKVTEDFLQTSQTDKVDAHRRIGQAIFARSAELYTGQGLPEYLVRYTYPAFLSVHLNTHCNAACFFCREADYKGTSLEFDNLHVLTNAIRHARIVDLTGWGEPFLYPKFEKVVEHVLQINPSPHMIFLTTNGSLLSRSWGQRLSGKIHKLVISVNAGTAETYDTQMRYKNAAFTFDNLLENLREFLPMLNDEDRRGIDLHMVANTGNFREASDLVKIAADFKIPLVSIGHYICAQPQHMDKVLWNVKQEYNDELSRARKLGATLGVQVHGRKFFMDEKEVNGADKCVAPFESIFIETTGKTTPCCFMGNERFGHIYEDGFEAVWFSEIMNKLRHKRDLPPCKVCTVFSPFDLKTTHISASLLTKKSPEIAVL